MFRLYHDVCLAFKSPSIIVFDGVFIGKFKSVVSKARLDFCIPQLVLVQSFLIVYELWYW